MSFCALKEPKVLLKGAADAGEAAPVAFEMLKILEVLVEPKGLFSVASLLSLLLLVFVSVGLVERALKAGREPPTVDDEFATGNEKEDVAEASVVEGVIDVD